jgi:hypothetical protein
MVELKGSQQENKLGRRYSPGSVKFLRESEYNCY